MPPAVRLVVLAAIMAEDFARLADPLRPHRRCAMEDIAMAALSVFVMRSPSFLAHHPALADGRARCEPRNGVFSCQ